MNLLWSLVALREDMEQFERELDRSLDALAVEIHQLRTMTLVLFGGLLALVLIVTRREN